MSKHMSVKTARDVVVTLGASKSMLAEAARTIVAQAGQITRLQAALRAADRDAAFWVSADCDVGPLTHEEPDWGTYNLLPGDMEAEG